MNKKILSAIVGLSSLFFLYSCGNDDPAPIPTPTTDSTYYATNKQIKELMVNNYYWAIPDDVSMLKETSSYFTDLKNKQDSISNLQKLSDLTIESTYDVGFDYGVNRYADGKLFYIIYYVKPNSSAFYAGLERGWVISKVNGIAITEDNKMELLSDQAKNSEGHKVKLIVLDPTQGNTADFTITATLNTPENPENPLYVTPGTNPIITDNGNRVGYFVYNAFESSFDKQLVEKLQSFSGQVDYLVIDLRYNVGGSYKSALTLASALVKSRTNKDVFLVNQMRLKNESYTLIDTSESVSIPKLGDQLKKVYVITGKTTQGMGNAFINSLSSYLGSDLVVAGEKSIGTNRTEGYSTIDDTWRMHIVTGKWANKDGNSTFNTVPTLLANDVNENIILPLSALGNPQETILAAVLNNIKGVTTYRSFEYSNNFGIVSPSLKAKAKLYQSGIELK